MANTTIKTVHDYFLVYLNRFVELLKTKFLLIDDYNSQVVTDLSEVTGDSYNQSNLVTAKVARQLNDAIGGGNVLHKSDVVNNLSSTSADLPLSANQGRELNAKIPTFTLSGTTLYITKQ